MKTIPDEAIERDPNLKFRAETNAVQSTWIVQNSDIDRSELCSTGVLAAASGVHITKFT